MSLSKIFIHFVWSTKNREPILTATLEPRVHTFLGVLAKEIEAKPIAINGIDDHVHLLLELPTTLCVADCVRVLKSKSSKWTNDEVDHRVLQWQEKYAAFSVSRWDVSKIERYIHRQKKHHFTETHQSEMRREYTEAGIPFDERYVWQ